MGEVWSHQVRVYVDDADQPLPDAVFATLQQHDATLVSQLQAFEAYLADPAAAGSPLGRWTAATLADPEKRAKHRAALAVRVRGAEVYDAATADAVETALRPFVADGTFLRLSRHDTNPATNMPIPAAFTS